MRRLLFLLLITTLFAPPAASRAQTANWDFILFQNDLSGPPDSTLLFRGSITNSTRSDLFINSVGLDFDTFPSSSYFDIDFADDFINTGLTIPVTGYTGNLFFLHWHADAPTGLQGTGKIEIFADPPAGPDSIPQGFTASVSSAGPPPAIGVPEPGLLIIPGACMLNILPFVRRKRSV